MINFFIKLFIFCVFFMFLTDRKCRPLSSFWKSGGFRWIRNVIYERQILLKVFGFWFHFWSRSGSTECTRIGGSLSFCHLASFFITQLFPRIQNRWGSMLEGISGARLPAGFGSLRQLRSKKLAIISNGKYLLDFNSTSVRTINRIRLLIMASFF